VTRKRKEIRKKYPHIFFERNDNVAGFTYGFREEEDDAEDRLPDVDHLSLEVVSKNLYLHIHHDVRGWSLDTHA
jgi:hypothetical protein